MRYGALIYNTEMFANSLKDIINNLLTEKPIDVLKKIRVDMSKIISEQDNDFYDCEGLSLEINGWLVHNIPHMRKDVIDRFYIIKKWLYSFNKNINKKELISILDQLVSSLVCWIREIKKSLFVFLPREEKKYNSEKWLGAYVFKPKDDEWDDDYDGDFDSYHDTYFDVHNECYVPLFKFFYFKYFLQKKYVIFLKKNKVIKKIDDFIVFKSEDEIEYFANFCKWKSETTKNKFTKKIWAEIFNEILSKIHFAWQD